MEVEFPPCLQIGTSSSKTALPFPLPCGCVPLVEGHSDDTRGHAIIGRVHTDRSHLLSTLPHTPWPWSSPLALSPVELITSGTCQQAPCTKSYTVNSQRPSVVLFLSRFKSQKFQKAVLDAFKGHPKHVPLGNEHIRLILEMSQQKIVASHVASAIY